jgi:uncharacterized protein YndB with AHSA1/START domain
MSVTSVVRYFDSLTLTVVAEFHVPIERVWQPCADPRRLERWWGRRATRRPCRSTT